MIHKNFSYGIKFKLILIMKILLVWSTVTLGRKIANKRSIIVDGINTIELSNLNLSKGVYLLTVVGENNFFSTKLMNNH